jgi:hypothetical protein
MTSTKPLADTTMAPPLTDEADIGSGEKTPAQLETERMIREIPPLPPGGGDGSNSAAEDNSRKGDAPPAEAGRP